MIGVKPKVMRRRKIWLSIIVVMIIVICSAGIGLALKPDNTNELVVAVVSLAVALLALYISLRTFYSIDEVNAISRMDGNVMENPRYRPNLFRAVFRFPKSGFEETSKDLMEYMKGLFLDNSKQSGAHLADNVLEVADLLVLIPYFIKTNSAFQLEQVTELLNTIKNKVNNFKEISDGSCKLLEETVNLIDSVFAYQKMTAKGDSDPSKLLEIRGSIFINPVTCILYNDYLGLYFLRRATTILCKHQSGLSLKKMIEGAKTCPADDKSMALVYCQKAIDSFRRAKENIGDDTIWTGYVCFNMARAEYLKQFLKESFGETSSNEWEAYINESIRSWITSNKIISEHFSAKLKDGQVTWLQQAFISEENFVRLSKIVLQMLRKEPLTDYNGNAWVKKYSEVLETPFFKRIPENDPQQLSDSLVEDIKELIKNN